MMANIMDPILPIASIMGSWAIILGSFGGPGICMYVDILGPSRGYYIMTKDPTTICVLEACLKVLVILLLLSTPQGISYYKRLPVFPELPTVLS